MRMAKQPLDPLLLDAARWTGVGAALHSQQALMLLQQQLFDYATERYCRALENEGNCSMAWSWLRTKSSNCTLCWMGS